MAGGERNVEKRELANKSTEPGLAGCRGRLEGNRKGG